MRLWVIVLIGSAILLGGIGYSGSAFAAGSISVENRSPMKIKVVGDGGSSTIEAGAAAMELAFDGGKDVGIDVKIWWTNNVRELCQLFVPWGRTVVVSGTTYIRCRSE
jgi:hypothetical protein